MKFRKMKSVEKSVFLNNKFFEIDGKLYHREFNCYIRNTGAVGCVAHGYLIVRIEGKTEFIHRIIFAMVNGFWPENEIDHIDGDSLNNRPDNLQEASHDCNMTKKHCLLGTSGIRGVNPNNKCWIAKVSFNGKRINAPTRKTKIEATWDWCSLMLQKLDWEHCQMPQLQANFDLIEEDFNNNFPTEDGE